MCAAALVVGVLAAPAQADAAPATDPAPVAQDLRGAGWALKDTGKSDVRFRGLAAVTRTTAWVAGSKGTVLRTVDGGRSWRDVSPPGAVAEGLEFRDIEAFDARRAVALSIGEGEASRVLRTEDGGATWTEAFRNPDPRAFYDCLTFFDARHGLAMSDPVDGKFRILATDDGGRTWRVLPNEGMPEALPGEAGFAASGQCLVSSGPRDVWLATGGGAQARVLHSADRGLTWRVAESTVPAGDPARGVFALAFRDRTRGLAVGGDYRTGQASPQAAAVSADGDAPGARPRHRRRLPLGRGLVPVQPGYGARGRAHRHRCDHGRGSRLAVPGGGLLRHGRLRDGHRMLGGGEKGRVARLERRR